MEIPKCLDCGSSHKDYRSKRCFKCRNIYCKSKEWASSKIEIERRRKISINNGKSNLGGKIMTPEVREKIGKAHRGQIFSEEAIKKISNALKLLGHRPKPMFGKQNPKWQGDKVGYYGLHTWIARELGKPDKCEHCGKSGLTGHKIHWANKSQEYKRQHEDWIRLCAKCHKKYDCSSSVLRHL